MRARRLGYNRTTWNRPGSAEIEYNSWWTLEQLNADRLASRIGWIEDTWDLWMNHYEDYTWEELVLWDYSTYFTILGWNQTSWDAHNDDDDDDDNDNDNDDHEWTNKAWIELSEDEQWAADQVGYLEESWDYLTLDQYNWTCWQSMNTNEEGDDT